MLCEINLRRWMSPLFVCTFSAEQKIVSSAPTGGLSACRRSDHYAIDLVGGAERVRGVFDRVHIMYDRVHSQETASVHDDSFPLVGRESKSRLA